MTTPTQRESLQMLVEGCWDGDISRDDVIDYALILGCSDKAIINTLREIDGIPPIDRVRYLL